VQTETRKDRKRFGLRSLQDQGSQREIATRRHDKAIGTPWVSLSVSSWWPIN